MIIAVSGTPGTGKTTLAKKIADKLNYKYLDISKLVKIKKIYSGFDKERRCFIVDIKELNKTLIKKIKESPNLVMDSHLSHYLPEKYIDLCIITKCKLKVLEKRLKKRKYSKEKIRENLDSEIFDVCMHEAEEIGHKILVVDTTKGISLTKIINKIK